MTTPQFFLPPSGALWRRLPRLGRLLSFSRSASSSPSNSQKPIVLEKPARFNPPSHGTKLPTKPAPRHYGGNLSSAEVKAQEMKAYPGMMAPNGTWDHWIWHSRAFHLTLSLAWPPRFPFPPRATRSSQANQVLANHKQGTLTSLAIFTFAGNFKRDNPFADMMPSASDFLWHPLDAICILVDIVRLSETRNAAIVEEKRQRRIDDAAKRDAYRKAHGLPPVRGFWGITSGKEEKGENQAVVAPVNTSATPGSEQPSQDGNTTEAAARKKWLGIF